MYRSNSPWYSSTPGRLALKRCSAWLLRFSRQLLGPLAGDGWIFHRHRRAVFVAGGAVANGRHIASWGTLTGLAVKPSLAFQVA